MGSERHEIGVLAIDDWQEGQVITAAAMVLIFIAAVLVGRVRRYASLRNMLLLAALLTIALNHLLSTVLSTGFDSLSANRFATWTTAGIGVMGGLLLAASVLLPDHPILHARRMAHLLVLGCLAGIAGIVASAWLLRGVLPGAFSELPLQPEDLELLTEHPALFVVEALTAVCYGVTGYAFAGIAADEDDDLARWFGLGCTVAAVAYLNYALFPSQFTELLYLGDLFFLLAVALLAIGAVREIANAEEAQVRVAILHERRRIARDLHDGVAQELAYMESQIQAAVRRGDRDADAWGRFVKTVDRAVDESRSAINALSQPLDETVAGEIARTALDRAERGGARVNLDLDQDVECSSDVRTALVRIVRESVGNAVRHGGARTISVSLSAVDGIALRIHDDGAGFDPESPEAKQGFGLTSMRERTESLEGIFQVISAPGSGTTVEVKLL
jgi:signal transduction histidine kinase